MMPGRASGALIFALEYSFFTEVSTDDCWLLRQRAAPSLVGPHTATFTSKGRDCSIMTRTSDESGLSKSPLHLFHRAVQVVTEIYQTEMSSYDLTARQYAVLYALAHSDGMSQSRLVDATGIDRSTMADIVRRMLKKGIIQRKRDKDDARAYEVKITEEGERLFRAVAPIVHRIEERLLSSLNAKRADEFLANLGTIVSSVAPTDGSAELVEAEAGE